MRKKINNVVKSNVELLTSPFMTFFRHEASSGIILLLFAILALVLANTSLSTFYNEVLNTQIPLGPAKWHLDLTILYWINDGLMAIFFFVIGLEIKREFLFGELKSLSATILPISAAIGGMIVPAILYYLVNMGQDTVSGWGIPMATDIAFSLGILAIAASGAPRSIAIFLTALAIVDDLGAIIVIAIFYNSNISFAALGMNYPQMMRHVILPQVIRIVLPPVSNETINLVKDTSLIYILAMNDLLRVARSIVQREFDMTPFLVAAIFYLFMTFILTWGFKKLEAKYNISTR